MTTPFKIAIAGLGTVGGGVVKALAARGDELSSRAGRKLEIIGVSARDKNRARGFDVKGWTDDPLCQPAPSVLAAYRQMRTERGAAE